MRYILTALVEDAFDAGQGGRAGGRRTWCTGAATLSAVPFTDVKAINQGAVESTVWPPSPFLRSCPAQAAPPR